MDFLLHLGLGTVLGGLIGLERQWHQRYAGLRTNALVATGAAAFALVALSPLAQPQPGAVLGAIVTGIGFLGAGVIFKAEFNVRGLSTAATVWCSAAVGTLCGLGQLPQALSVAGIVIAINTLLRPLSRRLSQSPASRAAEMESTYRLDGLCAPRSEPAARSLLLQEAAALRLKVRDLRSERHNGSLRFSVDLVMEGRDDQKLSGLAARLGALPGLRSVRWQLQHSASHFE